MVISFKNNCYFSLFYDREKIKKIDSSGIYQGNKKILYHIILRSYLMEWNGEVYCLKSYILLI